MYTALLPLALFAIQPADDAVQDPVEPAPSETAAENVDAELDDVKMICRRQSIAGSRLKARKVCKTEKGWAIYEADTRDQFKRARDRQSDTAK